MPHLVGLPASDALLALELATTCHVTEKPCAPEISHQAMMVIYGYLWLTSSLHCFTWHDVESVIHYAWR